MSLPGGPWHRAQLVAPTGPAWAAPAALISTVKSGCGLGPSGALGGSCVASRNWVSAQLPACRAMGTPGRRVLGTRGWLRQWPREVTVRTLSSGSGNAASGTGGDRADPGTELGLLRTDPSFLLTGPGCSGSEPGQRAVKPGPYGGLGSTLGRDSVSAQHARPVVGKAPGRRFPLGLGGSTRGKGDPVGAVS